MENNNNAVRHQLSGSAFGPARPRDRKGDTESGILGENGSIGFSTWAVGLPWARGAGSVPTRTLMSRVRLSCILDTAHSSLLGSSPRVFSQYFPVHASRQRERHCLPRSSIGPSAVQEIREHCNTSKRPCQMVSRILFPGYWEPFAGTPLTAPRLDGPCRIVYTGPIGLARHPAAGASGAKMVRFVPALWTRELLRPAIPGEN
jgi:hypothetical protein